MDAELLELQRQFQAAQDAKPSLRLSDRNIVELVNKLQDLDLLDTDLLHTLSGKEYITRERLRAEIEAEIEKTGRVSLIELADTTGVDLYHVERQVELIVTNREGLMLVQGEILSNTYWDLVAEEINERLQESSQISLAELAAQLNVSSELLLNILVPRLGTILQGKLEGGKIYTPLYVSRVRAMVCGAVRGVMIPTNLSSMWSSLHKLLQEIDGGMGGSVENSFFQNLLNSLVKEGEVLGSLRAGVSWTPAVFGIAQREVVESFFSQNSFINYDVLTKLAIQQPKQYLQSKYNEGIALDTVFVHPSMVGMLDASAEDAISHGGWLDSLMVLPTSFGIQDAAKLLNYCPSIQQATKDGRAYIMAATCVLSNDFVKALFLQLENDSENLMRERMALIKRSNTFASTTTHVKNSGNEMDDSPDIGSGSANASALEGMDGMDKRSKKKKGKVKGSAKLFVDEDDDFSQAGKGNRNKKRQGSTKSSNLPTQGSKHNHQKGSEKGNMDETEAISEDWITERILHWQPDIEGVGAGENVNGLSGSLASHIRTMLVSSWKSKKAAILAASAEKRRELIDKLQKHLDENYLNLQLFEKALDLFQEDSSTLVVLHRHLLRTIAVEITDKLLFMLGIDNKLQNGNVEGIPQDIESISLTPGERTALAKDLPGPLSKKALDVVEAVDGKQLETFNNALKSIVEESGLWLKKLDKKNERALLQSYRKFLTSQVQLEEDPVALLPKIVGLLYLQVYNKALQIPGRAISTAISNLKDRIPEKAYTTLTDFHSATVTLLSLFSAETNTEDDCTADRILTKRELLASKVSELKALISNSTSSS